MSHSRPPFSGSHKHLDQQSLVAAAKYILSEIERFSRLVIGLPLYNYQLKPLRAVIRSVLQGQGLEFLLVFPRQSGKNEAVAHLCIYLLNLFQRRGGNMVFGATGDGLGRGIRRLEQRLDNPWNEGRWSKRTRPTARVVGQAGAIFISTHPAAAARGETADWLLVIDELQDQSATHLEAVFEPMRAAHNATALYIGTVKSTTDALWLKKAELEAEQARDGQQRVFLVSSEEVVADNPDYGDFLARKIRRLGRRHPIVASEYFNEPLAGSGGLFDRRRLALMRGAHSRGLPNDPNPPARDPATAGPDGNQPDPVPLSADLIFVATLDVGGVDEAATDPLARLANPGRDYTVAHIFAVEGPAGDQPSPTYRAVDVFVDQGSRHFLSTGSQPGLAQKLLSWFQAWNVRHLVGDSSGVGAGLVDWLKAYLGADHVTTFNFNRHSKAALGVDFLSLIETGRFSYWSGDDDPLADGWWFFTQAQACAYSLPADGVMERDLRWGVSEGARIDTPAGSQLIHDDRLISAALVAVYDRLWRKGRLHLGRAASAIIPPPDLWDDPNY